MGLDIESVNMLKDCNMKRFYLRLSWICKEKEQRMAIDKETVKKWRFVAPAD